MKFCKQALGIDVSKDTLAVDLLALPAPAERFKVRGCRKFANTRAGYRDLFAWLTKKTEADVALRVVLEATGSYHENLAYYLYEQGCSLSILLGNKVAAYARSLNQPSKTDPSDARLLARLGLERSLRDWQPASDVMRQLRYLTRERQALMQDRLRHSNQIHALRHGHRPPAKIIRRHEVSVNLIERQIKAIESEMAALRRQDPALDRAMKRLQTIPQVGPLTAATVLAETAFFELFDSRSQVVKYAGMDIVEKQSGSSLQSTGRLSKRGNRRLRAALHMAAVGTIRTTGPLAELYARVYDRTRCKMKAVVAVQRKLLTLMYTLHKTEQDYDVAVHRRRSKKIGEPGGSPTVTRLAEAGRSS